MNEVQNRNAFFKRTRKGKVIKLTREKYSRNDVECGSRLGTIVTKENLQYLIDQSEHKHVLVLDTNIVILQIDALEFKCSDMSVIVVLQTVLKEVQHLNVSVYRRLCALLKDESKNFIFFPNECCEDVNCVRIHEESPNDWNDRYIRYSCIYYMKMLLSNATVVLLTNDIDNQRKAKTESICTMSMNEYVSKYMKKYTELMDLLAAQGISDSVVKSSSKLSSNLYTPHLSMDAISSGLRLKTYHAGVLRCKESSSKSGDAWSEGVVVVHSSPSNNKKRKADQEANKRRYIAVSGFKNINRALDGDVVCVEIITEREMAIIELNSAHKQDSEEIGISRDVGEATTLAMESIVSGSHENDPVTCGRIVGIIRRNWRQYAGTLVPYDGASENVLLGEIDMDGGGGDGEREGGGEADGDAIVPKALFLPVSPKIPQVIVYTRRLDELAGMRVLVAVDHWPANSHHPIGHFIRSIGDDTNREVETKVLLHEHGVPNEAFTAEVMACLPKQGWSITPDIVAKRTDLRHIAVVSIDPPGCKDIDDALHCRKLPNGNFEVGVHIADVTYFIDEDTPLDKEASHRSTSTYLVDRRLDMLPGYLTTELCSLRSSEDHLAFSVLWEMDENANIIDVSFFKSVIRSVASMTYDEAQAILDTDDSGGDDDGVASKITSSVKWLNLLARRLRDNRILQGALTLASPEVRFKFDGETDNPTDVSMYNIKESNQLVEEFMLLANITVSKKILRHFPTLSVLRRHQPPSQEQFAPLLSAARAVNVGLDISSSKTLADSLDCAQRPGDPFFNKLLRMLSTKCMMPAQYFCSGELPKDQWHHYGLAAPVYTHFTSPIRRYADVVVHRLLAAAIGVSPLHASSADRSKVQELCTHMNRRHKSAQHIQRASTNMHTILYFRNRPSVEEGYVLSVNDTKITVFIPKFGLVGPITFLTILTTTLKEEVGLLTQGLAGGSEDVESYLNRKMKDIVTFNEITHTAQLHIPIADSSTPQKAIHGSTTALSLQVFQQVLVSICIDEGQHSSGNSTGSRRLIFQLVLQDKKNDAVSDDKEIQQVSKRRKKEKLIA